MEYIDTPRGRGVLYAFRGTDRGDTSHTFVLKGLQPQRRYRLHFRDGSAGDKVLRGSALMRTGVEVTLPLPDSSELVLLQAL
jgi:hypothetical protein